MSHRTQPTGKISVNLHQTDFCKKLEKVNLALSNGYPSQNTGASELQKDHFVKDLFATRINKLPWFVSLIPDPLAWAVYASSLRWEDLDP